MCPPKSVVSWVKWDRKEFGNSFFFCEVCDAAVQVAEPVTQSLDSAVQVVSFPFTYGNEPISLPNTKTQDSLAAPLHR